MGFEHHYGFLNTTWHEDSIKPINHLYSLKQVIVNIFDQKSYSAYEN